MSSRVSLVDFILMSVYKIITFIGIDFSWQSMIKFSFKTHFIKIVCFEFKKMPSFLTSYWISYVMFCFCWGPLLFLLYNFFISFLFVLSFIFTYDIMLVILSIIKKWKSKYFATFHFLFFFSYLIWVCCCIRLLCCPDFLTCMMRKVPSFPTYLTKFELAVPISTYYVITALLFGEWQLTFGTVLYFNLIR